jgi:hypothetical protein
MEYYLQMPGDTIDSAMFDSNLIGIDGGFGVFWPGLGLKILMNMVNETPEALTVSKIITSSGNTLSVTEFLNQIEKLKIKTR